MRQVSANLQIENVPSSVFAMRINWFALVFIAPALLLVLMVSLYPVVDALTLSVFDTRFAQRLDFIGTENYVELIRDPSIYQDIVNSFTYTFFSLAVVLPYGLGVALLLNRDLPIRGLYRTLAIMPWVFSQTITALLWAWLINSDFGPVTHAVQFVTGTRPAVLSSPSGAMGALIGVNVWASYPMATLLFLAALQTIPRELFEAAEVDGAGAVRRFFYITLPLIRHTALVVIIQLTLLYFNMVTLIYIFTGGGPIGETETLALRVLKISFEDWELGRGAALGVFITLVNLFFSLVYVRALRNPTDE